jgi:hypothetical protein
MCRDTWLGLVRADAVAAIGSGSRIVPLLPRIPEGARSVGGGRAVLAESRIVAQEPYEREGIRRQG